MTKFAGRRGSLALALEDSRGVPPTSSSDYFWVPFATMSFKDTVEEAREDQGMGVLADGDSKYVVMKMGEGEVEAQLYDKALGVVLAGVLGAVPSSSGSNPYTHTYTLSNSNQHQSVSIYWSDPDRKDMYKLGMVDSFQISAEPSGIVNYTIGFKSKTADEWTTITPVFTSLGSKFLHQHVGVKLAAAVGDLTAATAISLKSLELTVSKNTMFDSVMGTVEPEDVLNQQIAVEGTLELNLEADTYRDYMLNGTYRAMEVALTNGSSSILTLRFPRVDFSEWEPDFTLNEIAKQTINFKANYDAANALDIISTATLVNAQASY
jgi:hypothetical protein